MQWCLPAAYNCGYRLSNNYDLPVHVQKRFLHFLAIFNYEKKVKIASQ